MWKLDNPYHGNQVRWLQEQLYRTVANASMEIQSGDDREAYHLIREAFDIVIVLRPGYGDSTGEE